MKKRAIARPGISLEDATAYAQSAATRFGLPQTVYFDQSTGDWSNTNPFSSFLQRNPVQAVTVLPANYFL